MKIKNQIILSALVLFLSSFVSHRLCESAQFIKGSYYEMEHYKNKELESITKHKVTDVKTIGTQKESTVHTEFFSAANVKEREADIKLKCDGKFLSFDLKDQLKGDEFNIPNMDVEIVESTMTIPTNFTVGQTLPDNVVKVKMKSQENGQEVGKMTMSFTNRKVVAKEKVTTKAGTFDCFKVTTDIKNQVEFMGKVTPIPGMKMVVFINKEVGEVKSETKSDNGELTETSELTKFKKP